MICDLAGLFEMLYSSYPNIIYTLESEATGRGNAEVLALEAYCFLALSEGK